MKSNIERLFRSVRRERGTRNERLVRSAIQTLLDAGQLDDVKSSRDLDVRGVDYLITHGRKRYKLQVKSSPRGIEQSIAHSPERYRHGDIIFIVPGAGETREELGQRILGMINQFEEDMHRK